MQLTPLRPVPRALQLHVSIHRERQSSEFCTKQGTGSQLCDCQEAQVFSLHTVFAQLVLCFLRVCERAGTAQPFPRLQGHTEQPWAPRGCQPAQSSTHGFPKLPPRLSHIIGFCKTCYQALHGRAHIQRSQRANAISCNFSNFCFKNWIKEVPSFTTDKA